MPHSYCLCYMHIVFSTKGRLPSITPELESRLHGYLGGIASQNKMIPLEIGGVSDHVHLLVALPSTLSPAKAVQLLKGNSSKWIHQEFSDRPGFEWQEGYGAFSVGISGIESTRSYIKNQPEHHKHVSFQEEYRGFLKAHHIEFDERHIWG